MLGSHAAMVLGAYPDPRSIATLAEWIAAAERPLIIAATLSPAAVEVLGHLAERCAIPVITHNPRTVCLPSSHAMHFGFEPGTLLAIACRLATTPFLEDPPMRAYPGAWAHTMEK